MKQTYLLFVALAFLFLATLLMWRSCQPEPGFYDTINADSIQAVLNVERQAFRRAQDSALAQQHARDSVIGELALELSQAKTDARKSARSASYWASRYDSAKAAGDTDARLQACDSLRDEHEIYVYRAELAMVKADSVIALQQTQINDQRILIGKQATQIVVEQGRVDLLLTQYNLVAQENSKLKRKVKNSWWKAVVGFVAGYGVSKL